VIERFGRPETVIISLDEYAPMHFRLARAAFCEWFDQAAARNAEHNSGLNDEHVLTIIKQAGHDVAAETERPVVHVGIDAGLLVSGAQTHGEPIRCVIAAWYAGVESAVYNARVRISAISSGVSGSGLPFMLLAAAPFSTSAGTSPLVMP
jgi:hypothetical protein